MFIPRSWSPKLHTRGINRVLTPSMQHKKLFSHISEKVETNISAFTLLRRPLTPLNYWFFWNNSLKLVSMASCGAFSSLGTHTFLVAWDWTTVCLTSSTLAVMSNKDLYFPPHFSWSWWTACLSKEISAHHWEVYTLVQLYDLCTTATTRDEILHQANVIKQFTDDTSMFL